MRTQNVRFSSILETLLFHLYYLFRENVELSVNSHP